jgi:hypothetical protein
MYSRLSGIRLEVVPAPVPLGLVDPRGDTPRRRGHLTYRYPRPAWAAGDEGLSPKRALPRSLIRSKLRALFL